MKTTNAIIAGTLALSLAGGIALAQTAPQEQLPPAQIETVAGENGDGFWGWFGWGDDDHERGERGKKRKKHCDKDRGETTDTQDAGAADEQTQDI